MIFPHAAAAAAKENCLFRVTFVVVWPAFLLSFSICFLIFSCSAAFVVVSSLFRLFAHLTVFCFFFFFVDEKNPLVRKARDKWCAAAALSLDFHTQIGNSPQTFEFYYFPDAAASLLFISFRWPNAEKFRFSNF